MANKKIQDLPKIDALAGGDILPLGRANAAYNAYGVTGDQLTAFIESKGNPILQGAQQAANRAESAEQNASNSASAAATAASSAQSSAEDASNSQQVATQKAQEANAAASSASQDAETALQKANEATSSAQQASQAATGAASSRDTAVGASQTATTARDEAVTAQSAAESAQQSAQQAQAGAQQAQQAIENLRVTSEEVSADQPIEVVKSVVEGVVQLLFKLKAGPTGQQGAPGSSIQKIERTSGTGAPGETDTYTVTLTDGNTSNFQVYNGRDGTGAGDFMADGSVPMTGNLQMGAKKITNVGAPTEATDAARKQEVDEKQDKITGQAGQVVGFDAEGNPVAQEAPDTGVISFNGRKGEVSPGADDYSADMIKFTDGKTFQQKYDSGELVGPPGKDGETGPTGTAGADGAPGRDATINGVNTLNVVEGDNITLEQSGSTLIISAEGGGIPVVTTSGTGAAYTVTVPGVTELTDGLALIILPNVSNTETRPTLNVNGLGAKKIGLYNLGGDNTSLGPTTMRTNYLTAGYAYLLIYTSNPGAWCLVGKNTIYASSIIVNSNSDYTANKVRGISFQTSTPSSIQKGSIVGVYSA